jgi:hypothetical protein
LVEGSIPSRPTNPSKGQLEGLTLCRFGTSRNRAKIAHVLVTTALDSLCGRRELLLEARNSVSMRDQLP